MGRFAGADGLDGVMMSVVKTVNFFSGDRIFVPEGGATKSSHLIGQAADFHVVGVADELWTQLYRNYSSEAVDHGQFGVPTVQYQPGKEFGQPRVSGPKFRPSAVPLETVTGLDYFEAQ